MFQAGMLRFLCVRWVQNENEEKHCICPEIILPQVFLFPRTDSEGGRGGEVVGANIVINTIIAMMQCAPV